MSHEISELGALDLAQLYRTKALSPVEVTQACLDVIAELESSLNAFCLLDADYALEQARASQQRFDKGDPIGELDGVPVAIKDVVLTRGWPTLRGSKLVDANQAWDVDAPAVERLRASGAVLVGKTTTPEFGWKAVTDSPLTGVTRNPWDLKRTSGGSSGGSAVAVASGMVPLALGTDGAGSIRIPASFCGIYGIKPTFGVVPAWPPSPFGSLSHLGPLACSVEDLEAFLRVVSGQHRNDPSSAADIDFRPKEEVLSGLRVAYSPSFAGGSPTLEVERLVSTAVVELVELGAHMTMLDGVVDSTLPIVDGLWSTGAADVMASLDQTRLRELDPGFEELASSGGSLSAMKYLDLLRERQEVAVRMSTLFSDIDILVTPTIPIVAFEAGRNTPVGWPSSNSLTWTPYTHPFNISQQPAVTLPCGISEGLPVGIQLVARRHDDARLLRVAAALSRVLRFSLLTADRNTN